MDWDRVQYSRPDAIPLNGWDSMFKKATFNLSHWLKKVKKNKKWKKFVRMIGFNCTRYNNNAGF